VFQSNFSEGVQSKESNSRYRHIVNIHDSPELFHAILYYAYTDRITFTTDPQLCQGQVSAIHVDDVEEFYALAHRMLLDKLAEKALQLLAETSTVDNITVRALGKFGCTYEAVRARYTEFLLNHWDEVIVTSAFDEFFKEMENDPKEFKRINDMFRRLAQSRARKS
jgi:hypothetical protein